jgi:DNA polymerase-3 subunit delta'
MTSASALIHPWNHALMQTLVRDRARLSHALLFAGARGLGKNAFADGLARFLLCESPDARGAACGRCQSCQLFDAGSHPDLHVVMPEAVYRPAATLLARYALRYPPEDKSKESKDSTVIRIDQIRALIAASQTRPQIAARKVLILSPAETMNVNAANSLLKLLEEPPPDSHLLLVADRPARLAATIRSRCTRIDFHVPDAATASTWLEGQGLAGNEAGRLLALAGGAPLEALQLAASGFVAERDGLIADLETLLAGQGDPVACATRWKQLGTERCLAWLQGWLADLIRLGMYAGTTGLYNPDVTARLHTLEKRLHLKQLYGFADAVTRYRQLLGGGLDEQLILEDTLIRWSELRTA